MYFVNLLSFTLFCPNFCLFISNMFWMFKHIFLTNNLQALNLFLFDLFFETPPNRPLFFKRPLIARFSSNAPQLPISIPAPPEGRYRPKGALSPTVENDCNRPLLWSVMSHWKFQISNYVELFQIFLKLSALKHIVHHNSLPSDVDETLKTGFV